MLAGLRFAFFFSEVAALRWRPGVALLNLWLMYRASTFSETAHATMHRSLLRERLQRMAGARPIVDWLVEEANVRGYFGVTTLQVPDRSPSESLSDEQLVAALLMPHGELDVRLFKLVLRMIQRGEMSATRLWLEARKERADSVLFWLVERVPAEERSAEVERVAAAQPLPPRGYRPLPIRYDAGRLLRRPATRESTWRAARR